MCLWFPFAIYIWCVRYSFSYCPLAKHYIFPSTFFPRVWIDIFFIIQVVIKHFLSSHWGCINTLPTTKLCNVIIHTIIHNIKYITYHWTIHVEWVIGKRLCSKWCDEWCDTIEIFGKFVWLTFVTTRVLYSSNDHYYYYKQSRAHIIILYYK